MVRSTTWSAQRSPRRPHFGGEGASLAEGRALGVERACPEVVLALLVASDQLKALLPKADGRASRAQPPGLPARSISPATSRMPPMTCAMRSTSSIPSLAAIRIGELDRLTAFHVTAHLPETLAMVPRANIEFLPIENAWFSGSMNLVVSLPCTPV